MQSIVVKFACAFVLALFVNPGQSHAGIIVTNLSSAPNGTGTVDLNEAYAQEFTTGSTSNLLTTIAASLGKATGSYFATAKLVVDSGGLPDSTVLTTFTFGSIGTAGFSDVTFTANSSVTLAANANYWFILGEGGSGTYQWQYTNTTQANLPNYAMSNAGGPFTIGTPPGPFLIQVNGTPSSVIPEPSSIVLIALGVAFVASRRLASIVRTNP